MKASRVPWTAFHSKTRQDYMGRFGGYGRFGGGIGQLVFVLIPPAPQDGPWAELSD